MNFTETSMIKSSLRRGQDEAPIDASHHASEPLPHTLDRTTHDIAPEQDWSTLPILDRKTRSIARLETGIATKAIHFRDRLKRHEPSKGIRVVQLTLLATVSPGDGDAGAVLAGCVEVR